MTTTREPSGHDHKMTAEEINRLPIAAYEGVVHVVRSQDGLAHAVSALQRETVLGFDTETKPNFAKGEDNPLSLIQLAGARAVYVFQLRHLSSYAELRRLLSEGRIVKAGVNIGHDVAKIQQRLGGACRGFVEIGEMAKRAGLKNFSLRGLAAVLLGIRITKGMRLSNWGRETLLPAQVTYAATDAWVGRQLYLKLRHTDSPKGKSGPAAA